MPHTEVDAKALHANLRDHLVAGAAQPVGDEFLEVTVRLAARHLIGNATTRRVFEVGAKGLQAFLGTPVRRRYPSDEAR